MKNAMKQMMHAIRHGVSTRALFHRKAEKMVQMPMQATIRFIARANLTLFISGMVKIHETLLQNDSLREYNTLPTKTGLWCAAVVP